MWKKKKIGINIASHLDRAKLSKPETKLLFLLSIAPEEDKNEARRARPDGPTDLYPWAKEKASPSPI